LVTKIAKTLMKDQNTKYNNMMLALQFPNKTIKLTTKWENVRNNYFLPMYVVL